MLPRTAYLYPTGYEQIASEQNDHYAIDLKEGEKRGWLKQTSSEDGQSTIISLVPNVGVYMPVKDAMFPLKCFASANAVFAANLIKAHLMETVKLLAKWYLFPFLLLLNKQAVLDAFNRISMKSFSPYLLVDNCLTDFSRTLKVFLVHFLDGMGFTADSTHTFAILIANLIDLDNAYRLRFEDTISETSKERLQNPRKEIKRLLQIMKDREIRPGVKGRAIHYKFKVFAYLLSLIMLRPKVKRAFLSALKIIDLEKMSLDTVDVYWTNMRCDYLWRGMTETERQQDSEKRGWTYPRPMS